MQILIALGIGFGLLALAIFALTRIDTVASFAMKALAIPPVMIARTFVIVALLPAAFSMASAERDLASINPQEQQAPAHAQALMKKMSKAAATSWIYGQTDEPGMRIAFKIARSIVKA